jgi:hypothetical protein
MKKLEIITLGLRSLKDRDLLSRPQMDDSYLVDGVVGPRKPPLRALRKLHVPFAPGKAAVFKIVFFAIFLHE